MARNQAEELHGYINTMLNLFLVNEQRFPSAKGRMRYNALDFQALRFVSGHPDCRGADISRALGVAPTTLQSALDRLIRNGLIERRDHPSDGRGKIHRLTDQGEDLREAIREQDMDNMTFLLDALNGEEREQILAILGKIEAQIVALLSEKP
ncbi:MAG: MarR family winged helix-turn-helix transcriptional regulator [Pseudomonadota bacterium]